MFEPKIEKIAIANSAHALSEVNAWLQDLVGRFGISNELAFKIDLVISEILPNIISYGYIAGQADQIEVALEQHSQQLILQIADHGIPFNPFAYPEFQPVSSLEEAEIGGRGIHLMKSFSDVQEYLYDNHTNITRLRFFIKS